MPDGQTRNQCMRCTRLSDHLAGFKIEDDGFDALGAGIDADEKTHGFRWSVSFSLRGSREDILILKLEFALRKVAGGVFACFDMT
jgi:hypothetical protein